MAQIENLERLRAKLQALAKSRQERVSVSVGYTQNYALYVHENLESFHPIGQAKFLEQPARENAREYGEITRDAVRQGKTLSQGLLLAGLKLQRDSQLLCPVLTGALRASAFTRLDDTNEVVESAT